MAFSKNFDSINILSYKFGIFLKYEKRHPNNSTILILKNPNGISFFSSKLWIIVFSFLLFSSFLSKFILIKSNKILINSKLNKVCEKLLLTFSSLLSSSDSSVVDGISISKVLIAFIQLIIISIIIMKFLLLLMISSSFDLSVINKLISFKGFVIKFWIIILLFNKSENKFSSVDKFFIKVAKESSFSLFISIFISLNNSSNVSIRNKSISSILNFSTLVSYRKILFNISAIDSR